MDDVAWHHLRRDVKARLPIIEDAGDRLTVGNNHRRARIMRVADGFRLEIVLKNGIELCKTFSDTSVAGSLAELLPIATMIGDGITSPASASKCFAMYND